MEKIETFLVSEKKKALEAKVCICVLMPTPVASHENSSLVLSSISLSVGAFNLQDRISKMKEDKIKKELKSESRKRKQIDAEANGHSQLIPLSVQKHTWLKIFAESLGMDEALDNEGNTTMPAKKNKRKKKKKSSKAGGFKTYHFYMGFLLSH